MSEILVAKNITKIYGIGTSHTFEALHGVSMTMNEGEFICVMGPSGAGKSTFINNLSTIDIPTKGKVYINDTEVRSMGESEIGKFRYENLGFIFQEFNLLDSHTSHEILEIFKELNDQDGVSILMVTHDPMIASYSQKLLYIKDGVIAKQVVKGDLTQKEYFHKIVDVNSAESMSLFEGE